MEEIKSGKFDIESRFGIRTSSDFLKALICNAYISCYERKLLVENYKNDLYEIAKTISGYSTKDIQKMFYHRFDNSSKEEIIEYIKTSLDNKKRFYDDYTDKDISKLCGLLLDFDGGGHMLLDMGSGIGGFLFYTYLDCFSKRIYFKDIFGIEINGEDAHISQMLMDIIYQGEGITYISKGNALDDIRFPYTRGFVCPPFGMKQLFNEKVKKSRLFPKIEFTNRNSIEWLFIDNLLSRLAPHGRAVAIVSGKALFSDADKEYRKLLAQSGRLEGIIELPENVLGYTGIKSYILVFSHDNLSVKVLDASKEFTISKMNKERTLSVSSIYKKYLSKEVTLKTIEELEKTNNFMPSHILTDVIVPENGVALGELAEVFTGSQYTLRNFEEMFSEVETGYRILTSSDIEDGMVDWSKLQIIVPKDNKFDKYAVRKNDVIVTSKSSKVKIAVVDIEPKEKILVTGGMLIVRPNIERLNPTYLKIYLESEQGQAALKLIQKGATIVSINAKDLALLPIPLIDIESQFKRADKYNYKLSVLYSLKQQILEIEKELKDFYLEGSDKF